MEQKRKAMKRIGLLLSVMFSLVCLFSSFTAAYSWYSAVRAVNGTAGQGDGGGFQASETPLAFDRIDIYPQIKDTSSSYFSTTVAGSYTIGIQNGKQNVSYSGSKKLSFGQFDSLRGTGGQLLYLFHVRENLPAEERAMLHIKAYTETMEENSLFKSTTKGNEITNKNPLHEEDNPISNILEYQVYTYENGNTPLVNSSHYDLDSNDPNRSEVSVSQNKFINKLDDFGYLDTNESDRYLDTLSLLPAGEGKESVTMVAVVVRFSKELFNNLFSINLGNEVLSASSNLSNPTILFKDDWGFRI
jgi:hypothetical protein